MLMKVGIVICYDSNISNNKGQQYSITLYSIVQYNNDNCYISSRRDDKNGIIMMCLK